ncbi:hypothetical protein BJK06_15020 [Curtobacterium sp. BH-2-1-1]|nr:hypothetical protein BJK06_15020 [Curtobacterium sp. BH-2-1-1]
MTVAVLLATGLAVFAVGHAEALGLTSGRTTIDLIDVPFGPTKAEHVNELRDVARSHNVDFALVTPARNGAPAEFDAYVLSGGVAPSTFWTRTAQHSSAEVGDAVILWTYAIDGTPSDIVAFLQSLRAAGFEYSVVALEPVTVLASTVLRPGIAAVTLATIAGLLIALVAESRRRLPRNRARSIVGWSRRRIASREALDGVVLVVACAVPVVGGLLAFVAIRGASPALIALLVPVTAALIISLAAFVVVVSAGSTVLPERFGTLIARGTAHTAIVSTAGVLLVVLLTSTSHTLFDQVQTTRVLDVSLAAEATAGDDVTLGVGFASEEQDLALGTIGAGALEHGTARMSMTNFAPDSLLIAGAPTDPLLDGGTSPARDGVTVLVPERLASDRARIRATVAEAFADGWEVDDTEPTRATPIDVEIVASTAPLVQSADRWVTWLAPRNDGSDDVPVIVLHTLSDLAPNRFGTAVHNGEVRFADRDALVSDLRETSAIDVVTQINRVGATIERERATVQIDTMIAIGAACAGGASILFAAVQLVGDHRRRTAPVLRLRSLVGRRSAATHVPFVAVCALVSACAASVTSAKENGLLAAGLDALTAGLGVVGVLTVVLGVTTHRDRIGR